MNFNNKPSTKPTRTMDEAANCSILAMLAEGTMTCAEIARRMHKSGVGIGQRLYRLHRKGLIEQEPHRGGKWALPGTFEIAHRAPDKAKVVPSRTAPDWRTSTLKYDLDAHRRLALMGR